VRGPTKSELESAVAECRRAESVHIVALNALVNNEVRWIRGGAAYGIRVGLCRLTAAHGGVVIVEHKEAENTRAKKWAFAKYLDDWAHDIVKRVPDNSESHNLYSLASAALRQRQAEYDEEAA
jgi:hypothetical protein